MLSVLDRQCRTTSDPISESSKSYRVTCTGQPVTCCSEWVCCLQAQALQLLVLPLRERLQGLSYFEGIPDDTSQGLTADTPQAIHIHPCFCMHCANLHLPCAVTYTTVFCCQRLWPMLKTSTQCSVDVLLQRRIASPKGWINMTLSMQDAELLLHFPQDSKVS